jgi:LysM repeat protein
MNQATVNNSETPRRNFETDVPRVDLIPGRKPVNKKLWAGMAGAAVVATVSIAALTGPAATTPGAPSAAGAITTADAPAEPASGPPVPAPLKAAPEPGAVDPASVPAAVAAPAETPALPAPEPAPVTDTNLYTVVPGDTVGGIAARHGVDMNAMLAANGLGGYSVIVPGQTLKLTGPAVAVSAPAPAQAVAPVQAAAAPAPVAAPAPAAPAPAAPAIRTIYVAGAGGQSMVDACIGPIHFTPNDGYSLFITEHDFCGGWARFSGIAVGETVSIPGYGTYTATARGQVPNPGTTNDVIRVFGGFPRAILQTCIPGTNQMLLIALN